MKKAMAVIVSLLFVLSFAGLSFTDEKAVTKEEAPLTPAKVKEKAVEKKAPAKIKQVTGEVTSCDTEAMTITVSKKMKGKAVKTVATVNNKTKIMVAKEKKIFTDVKVGNKVTVKYTEVDGRNVAKSVAIKPAEPAKPAEKK